MTSVNLSKSQLISLRILYVQSRMPKKIYIEFCNWFSHFVCNFFRKKLKYELWRILYFNISTYKTSLFSTNNTFLNYCWLSMEVLVCRIVKFHRRLCLPCLIWTLTTQHTGTNVTSDVQYVIQWQSYILVQNQIISSFFFQCRIICYLSLIGLNL